MKTEFWNTYETTNQITHLTAGTGVHTFLQPCLEKSGGEKKIIYPKYLVGHLYSGGSP